jgi:hypothetical protein
MSATMKGCEIVLSKPIGSGVWYPSGRSLLLWPPENRTMTLVGGSVRGMSAQNLPAGQPRHD